MARRRANDVVISLYMTLLSSMHVYTMWLEKGSDFVLKLDGSSKPSLFTVFRK
jgi:hypothetical protein